MPVKTHFRHGLGAIAVTALFGAHAAYAAPTLEFTKLWSYDAGSSVLDNYADQGVSDADLAAEAEIVAFDPVSQRFFVVNGREQAVDVLDVNGSKIGMLDTSGTGSPNSVAVKNGIVAIAVENGVNKQDAGEVFFYDAATMGYVSQVTTGALPDMVTFTPNGDKVLVANEGEPNGSYTNDPDGTISIIDISAGVAGVNAGNVTTLGFGGFSEAAIEAGGGRIFGNYDTASVAQDIEPEYITVSPDGTTAFVTLQENNAVAKVDLVTNTILEVQGLGYKDHSLPGNELDASDRDGIDGNLQNWPVLGMYLPDGIDSYSVGGQLYYVTANEGDARDYAGYSEEERVKDLDLDLNNDGIVDAFSPLQDDAMLGRLKTTSANGNNDADAAFEQIYSFGTRSFSIRDEDGNLVYDSGNLIETLLATQFPGSWVDSRSDDKGPEPETITIAQIDEWFYALVGLERANGLMVFDITDPTSPLFQSYISEAFDISPEGLMFALLGNYTHAHGGYGYVAVANEVSGTTTLYRVSAVPVPAGIALVGIGLLAMRLRFSA